MNSLTLKGRRVAVEQFITELNDKIKYFYMDVETLSQLSKRRVYKLLKLAYESVDKEIDKPWLKKVASIISNLDTKLNDKRTVNNLYSLILNTDIVDLTDLVAEDFRLIAIQESAGQDFEIVESNNIDTNRYLTLGILRL